MITKTMDHLDNLHVPLHWLGTNRRTEHGLRDTRPSIRLKQDEILARTSDRVCGSDRVLMDDDVEA